MGAEEMLRQRLELFDRTILGLKTDRVPTLSNDFNWRLLDTSSGVGFAEALKDFGKFRDITFEYVERYRYDCMVMAGMRNNIRMSEAVGGTHFIDEENGTIQALDRNYLYPDELKELNDDMIGTLWTKVAPRAFGDSTYADLAEAIQSAFEQYAVEDEIYSGLAERYGVPLVSGAGNFIPVEMLFNQYLGIKGLSTAMHRNRDEVARFCEQGEADYLATYENYFSKGHRNNPTAVWDGDVTMLAHSIMNRKQFEKYYWSTYGKMIASAVEHGCTILQFTEASILPFADFYQDIPKGVMTILVESDDLSVLRSKLPNITVAGGFDATILGHGTPDECREEAKRLIDELYPNYIFSTNKMISFRTDCNRENLLAVMDTVLNYDPN